MIRGQLRQAALFAGLVTAGAAWPGAGPGRAADGDAVPLIPRKVLFGNPERTNPHLSPDGKRLAFVAPSDKGVANIWVETLGQDDKRMVTRDVRRGIYSFDWAPDGQHVLYPQDRDGDENLHLHSVDLKTGHIRDLTPFVGVRTQNVLTSAKHPGEILVGLNLRDPRVFDLHRVDLATGAVTLETENPGDVLSWTPDAHFVIRACTAFDPKTGQTTVRVRDGKQSSWRDVLSVPFEDCHFYGQVNGGTLVAGFSADGKHLYVVSPLHSDKTRLVEIDAGTGEEVGVLATDPNCDVDYNFAIFQPGVLAPNVLTDPKTGKIQAVEFDYLKPDWKVLDPKLGRHFEALRKVRPGSFAVVDRAGDDSAWLVLYTADDDPGSYYLYEPKAMTARLLWEDRPELKKYRLAKCKPVLIRARDGLELVSYLTLPPEGRAKGLPLVLVPHGGPWFRDAWGYDALAQLLANRGYAVLQVNFRASTGFGKKHFNAANHEFGDGAVLGDLADAVRWAVEKGIVDPKRVAVMGGSFGGYATLCCITFHPELFVCAVDLVGPSSVKTLLQSFPSYWAPVKTRWVRRMGDAEHDEELDRKISPIHHVDRIRAPLLIGHGANDPRVHLSESERIVAAMRQRKLPVSLVVYPDEGHGFARPENNLDFFGRVEEFLAKHLGGRKEAWVKVPGSTAEVR